MLSASSCSRQGPTNTQQLSATKRRRRKRRASVCMASRRVSQAACPSQFGEQAKRPAVACAAAAWSAAPPVCALCVAHLGHHVRVKLQRVELLVPRRLAPRVGGYPQEVDVGHARDLHRRLEAAAGGGHSAARQHSDQGWRRPVWGPLRTQPGRHRDAAWVTRAPPHARCVSSASPGGPLPACPARGRRAPEEEAHVRALLRLQLKEVGPLVRRAAARHLVVGVPHQHLQAVQTRSRARRAGTRSVVRVVPTQQALGVVMDWHPRSKKEGCAPAPLRGCSCRCRSCP